MIIVLDSNEYINCFNNNVLLLNKITLNEIFTIYINETITKEVLNNINEYSKKGFFNFLFTSHIIAYNQKLPDSLLMKYKQLGLKKGDIAIAAFCEAIEADYLITENRHFLKSLENQRFIENAVHFRSARKSKDFRHSGHQKFKEFFSAKKFNFKVLSLRQFLNRLK